MGQGKSFIEQGCQVEIKGNKQSPLKTRAATASR